MQQQLISHNSDLKRLQEEGFDLEISGGQYLLVHHIPYITSSKEIKYGSFVCVLNLSSTVKVAPPPDHTVYFTGDTPYNADGTALTAIINNSCRQQLTEKIVVNHYLSSKPASGRYLNHYDKIRTYSEILAAQAQAIDKTVTTKPHRQKTVT